MRPLTHPHRLASRVAARLATLVLTLACTGAACDERSGGGTVTPGGHGSDSQLEPEGEFEGDSIDELQIRLDRLVEQQGVLIGAGNHDPAKCEELCQLSRAICEVKTKMCEIADERAADDEYQHMCRQAKQRCIQASDRCIRCVEHHERAGQSGPAGAREPATCEGSVEAEPSGDLPRR